MADDKGAVPTNSNTHMKILQNLVELWRREVMHKTPVKEQAEEGPSKDSDSERRSNSRRRD
jgi:hypothetical protein